MKKTLSQRFWEKVKIGTPDECWDWQASLSGDGYGQIRIRTKAQPRRQEQAHRLSYMLHFGGIPDGLFVLHSCKCNRKCVNPSHLRLGTHRDNMDDMVADGTAKEGHVAQDGELNHNAKLTAEDVRRIRWFIGEGLNNKEIARAFGGIVTHQTVSLIRNDKLWVGVSY